jgi:hypothetical protein
MEFEKDIGLDLLMNSKKKVSSDAISISSRSSSPRSEVSISIAEPIDVRKHLVPPSSRYSSQEEEDDDAEFEEDDDIDVEDEDDDDEESYASEPVKKENKYSRQAPRQRATEDDIINEKKELLYQFERLEKKGMRLPRKFTLASNLEDMRMEYERIKRDRELDTSVKFQRRMLMTAVSGLEFAADKIPFIGANLSGWSNNVNDELDEYDDIFMELHDKYKGKAKISAEVRLLGGLAGSAFMYHMTHKFSNSLPGLDSVLKSNPDLAAKLAEATRNQMNSQQQTAGNFFGGLGGLGSMFGNMFGGSGPQPPPPMYPDMAPQPQEQQPQQRARTPPVRMKGPNVDDILNELNSMNDDRVEIMSTISESDMPDDISSIGGMFMKNGRTIDLDI